MAKHPPPSVLSKEAKQKWNEFLEVCDQDPGPPQLTLLGVALEQFDLFREAAAILREQGQTIENHRGEIRAHPMVAAASSHASGFRQAYKLLGMDVGDE